MITLFQIDKSGSEIFEKDYPLALVKNNQVIYGINLQSDLKKQIIDLYNKNQLGFDSSKKGRLRFRIRFHTSIILLLLERAIKDEGYLEEVNIQICNDIDGHFHEISDMIYKRLSRLIPSLKKENIVQTKFAKTSLVNISAKNLREKNSRETSQYILLLEITISTLNLQYNLLLAPNKIGSSLR